MDSLTLAAIIVQDERDGKIGALTYTKSYEDVIRVMVSSEHLFTEEKVDSRTFLKRRVTRCDPRYLDVLKTRIGAPYAVYMRGTIQAATLEEGLLKLWGKFSPKEPRPITEV
jgi:hypothetical protein